MKKRIILFLFCLLLCSIFSACQKSPSDLIIGSWENEDLDTIIEFWEDGTIVMPDFSGVHYRLNEDGTKLTIYQDELHASYLSPGSDEMYTMDISITKDKMTLTLEGQTTVYNRVD